MLTKAQKELLSRFAQLSDQLFELGIITTDSFTGEIGEWVACQHFKLKKSVRVTKAIDAVCEAGNNYQVKAKVVSNDNFNYNLKSLDTTSFQFLIVVYFDNNYSPIKIIRITSSKIKDGKINITSSFLNSHVDVIDKSSIKLPVKQKKAISEFAKIYNELVEKSIIRSRRIVGDIGEYYACKKLNLDICENKTEKGIDARHKSGITFEIKTRRVYESGRRVSEARRLNNLVGKTADYLIVVALDRAFNCAGMWIMPMKNLVNPKSAKINIVNSTLGTLNIIPSTISWLNSGEKFTSIQNLKLEKAKATKNKKSTNNKEKPINKQPKKAKTVLNVNKAKTTKKGEVSADDTDIAGCGSFLLISIFVFLILLFIIL